MNPTPLVKMKKYSNVIERFLQGESGQRFFNIAYSIGAAIVIWGALFKILHLPGGNMLLCIGMGTEILMFILTAFDRPPMLKETGEDRVKMHGSGNSVTTCTGVFPENADDYTALAQTAPSMAQQMEQLRQTARALDEAGAALLESYRIAMEKSGDVSFDARDCAAQMEDLNRNIAGLNTIYEIQLKGVAGQIETIDSVNRSMKDMRDMYGKSAEESARYCEEAEKLSRHMMQLNAIYEKMIRAMTVNMPGGASGIGESNPFGKSV